MLYLLNFLLELQQHIKSGIAVAISTAGDGYKRMYVGNQNVGEIYIDE